jgi:hypothetical protein
MASAPYSSSFVQPVSLRRRALSFALALVANLLLLLMLFTLAPSVSPLEPARKPSTFSLLPDPSRAPTREPTERAKRARSKTAAAAQAPQRKPVPATPPTDPLPVPPVKPLNMIRMSRDVLAATDLAMNAPPRADNVAGSAAGAGAGQDNGADDGAGTGPGGERLYNAEWQTEPTNAQLAGYLPANGPRTGWGMIACRTLPQYRVDDCVELGQSPAGSGFARAVRQAAWQFRVRPPRVGDRRMVGAWVKIRITYGAEKPD